MKNALSGFISRLSQAVRGRSSVNQGSTTIKPNDDTLLYSRKLVELFDSVMILDKTIYAMIHSETNQNTRDALTGLRILALKRKQEFFERIAEIYEFTYTLDEMRGLVSFLESANGKAIKSKQEAALGRERDAPSAIYTPGEQKALTAFFASPAGQATKKKQLIVEDGIRDEVNEFLKILMDEAG